MIVKSVAPTIQTSERGSTRFYAPALAQAAWAFGVPIASPHLWSLSPLRVAHVGENVEDLHLARDGEDHSASRRGGHYLPFSGAASASRELEAMSRALSTGICRRRRGDAPRSSRPRAARARGTEPSSVTPSSRTCTTPSWPTELATALAEGARVSTGRARSGACGIFSAARMPFTGMRGGVRYRPCRRSRCALSTIPLPQSSDRPTRSRAAP